MATVAGPAQAGAPRSGWSPRPEPMQRCDWWRLTGGLGGRRWPERARGDHGACVVQGEGWWVSPRWRSSGDTAGFRRRWRLPAANGDAAGFLGAREREHDEVQPFWLGEGEQRSSPKRWAGGDFLAIFGEGGGIWRQEVGTWLWRNEGEG
jgi:hypothetical protein